MDLQFRSGQAAALYERGLARVYLIGGEEDRLKSEVLAAIVDRAVEPDFRDFDLERLDAEQVTADQISAAAAQAPFGSDRRAVIVKGLERWRDRGRQAEADRLAERIASLPESACLILVVAAEEDEGRRKSIVGGKLDAAAEKHGAIVRCSGLRGDALVAWVRARAKELGKTIAPAAAVQLVASAGEEMLSLEQELIKLTCYVGDRATIGPEDVSAVTVANAEDVMFQTVDAITRRQTDKALTLLGELHRHDSKPNAVAGRLLSLTARQYRMLWQAKFLAERRVNPRDVRSLPPELADVLPSEGNIAQISFKAAELFGQARGMEWGEIRSALELLLICDLANKGGATDETGIFGADPVYNLQLLVLELTGAA